MNVSHRTNGNTARVLSQIEEQMHRIADQAGDALDFETLSLGQQNIQMCRGCRICFDRREDHCLLKDDLPAIKAKMKGQETADRTGNNFNANATNQRITRIFF